MPIRSCHKCQSVSGSPRLGSRSYPLVTYLRPSAGWTHRRSTTEGTPACLQASAQAFNCAFSASRARAVVRGLFARIFRIHA